MCFCSPDRENHGITIVAAGPGFKNMQLPICCFVKRPAFYYTVRLLRINMRFERKEYHVSCSIQVGDNSGAIHVFFDSRGVGSGIGVPCLRARRSPQAQAVGSLAVSVWDPDTSNSDIWIVSSDGGTPRRMTTGEKGDSHPRWSPDGARIAFLSSREGASQIFIIVNIKTTLIINYKF